MRADKLGRDPKLLERRWYEHQLTKERIKKGLVDEEAPLQAKTVGDICDYWLLHRTPRKRSPKDDISIIGFHIRPSLGHIGLRALTVEHVDAMCAERAVPRLPPVAKAP